MKAKAERMPKQVWHESIKKAAVAVELFFYWYFLSFNC